MDMEPKLWNPILLNRTKQNKKTNMIYKSKVNLGRIFLDLNPNRDKG